MGFRTGDKNRQVTFGTDYGNQVIAPKEKGSWHVRAFRPGDMAQVAKLYQEVYRRPLDPAYYKWKLHKLQADGGVSNAWVAESEDQLVGHYGGSPRHFWLQGRTVQSRHTSDAMTSPRFRRQGMYSAVGIAAHNAWAAAGEPFAFGLPNDKWGSRVAYLNYRSMFPAVWLRRPLLVHRAITERFRVPDALTWPIAGVERLAGYRWDRALRRAAAGVDVRSVRQPGAEFDDLWERLRQYHEALVVRDRAWVRYRYHSVPGCDYRLFMAWRSGRPAGYLAYRLTQSANGPAGWILDIFTAPEDQGARAALLLAVLSALFVARATSVRILVPPKTRLYDQLRRAGFSPAPGEFGCHIIPLAWSDPLPLFADPDRWFTMAGDYDII